MAGLNHAKQYQHINLPGPMKKRSHFIRHGTRSDHADHPSPPWRLIFLLTGLFSLAIGQVRAAEGEFPPVQPGALKGASFNFYYGPDNKAVFSPGFTWTFSTAKTTITAGKHPIAADILEHLAAGGKKVHRIEADWHISGNHYLILSRVKIDGHTNRATWSLPLGYTAPTLIRIGEHQYVFTPKLQP